MQCQGWRLSRTGPSAGVVSSLWSILDDSCCMRRAVYNMPYLASAGVHEGLATSALSVPSRICVMAAVQCILAQLGCFLRLPGLSDQVSSTSCPSIGKVWLDDRGDDAGWWKLSTWARLWLEGFSKPAEPVLLGGGPQRGKARHCSSLKRAARRPRDFPPSCSTK